MNYIAHRRFKGLALCGEVNIPATSACEEINGVIFYNGSSICSCKSENAHQYFSRNDDEEGMLRGKLTQAIQKCLSVRDKKYQARWDKIWADSICQKYKRPDDDDYWLWNHDFFQASIYDLKHISKLIGIKEV